jgi:endonuclease III
MKLTCTVSRLANGKWLARHTGASTGQVKSYSTTYRLVQKAVEEGLEKEYSWLIQAHLLLRHHGQELCKRTKPECQKCPLAADCIFYQSGDT